MNYIDNDLFQREIAKWREKGEASEALGRMLLELHDHVLRHKNWNRYPEEVKEDMKAYSLYRILKNGLKTYDPSKAKAFSYFTKAVFMNYLNVVKKYYRQLERKAEYVRAFLGRMAMDGNQFAEALERRWETPGRDQS